MKSMDLSGIGAGFSNEALGSQRVFRSVLQALAHPGLAVMVDQDAQTPLHAHRSSAAALLALLDADCKVWLSASLVQTEAPTWLRFHTGCQIVTEPIRADFLWCGVNDPLPLYGDMPLGSDTYPDQSATLFVELPDDANRPDLYCTELELRGPGIEKQREFCLYTTTSELRNSLVETLQMNQATFPRGIDVVLSKSEQIIGLPRSTHVRVVTKG